MSSIPIEHQILRNQRATTPQTQPINLAYLHDQDNEVHQLAWDHRGLARNLIVVTVITLSIAIGLLTPYLSILMLLH
jgi:hypothetical protein